jgi:7-cyano-7-deazaguanine synthase
MERWGNDVKSVYDYATTILKGGCPNTLVILSGGMDSATCLALAKYMKPEKLGAITFNYGQQHSREVQDAMNVANEFDVGCEIIELNNLAQHFNTALKKDSDVKIPELHEEGTVPATYVPFRNTIMLSIAAGYAQSWGYSQIVYGANIIDYSGYVDCRPEYIDEMNDVLRIHDDNLFISAPIALLTKSDVVRLGDKLEVPWEKTWSCYRGGNKACGACPSCQYRLMGFEGAGVKDPIEYDIPERSEEPESAETA